MRALSLTRSELEKLGRELRGTAAQVKKAESGFGDWATGILDVRGAMAGLLAGLSAGAIAQGVGQVLDSLEDVERTAAALGTSVETVQELNFTFRQFRLESDDVADALNTLADRAEDAVAGTQSMVDDFALLGLSVDDLRGKSPEELFRVFAQAVANTADPTKRAAGVVRTLGDDLGRRLLPLLIQGEAGLDKFARKAEKAGAIVDEKTAAGASRAAQAFHDLKSSLGASFQRAVAENASKLEWLARAVNSVADAAIRAAAHPIDALAANPGRQPTALIERRDMLLEIMRQQDISAEAFANAARDYIQIQARIEALQPAPTLPAVSVRSSRPPPEAAKAIAGLGTEEEARRIAERVIAATRTPIEEYTGKIRELKLLLQNGLIDPETFERATQAAKKQLDELVAAAEFRPMDDFLAAVDKARADNALKIDAATESADALNKKLKEVSDTGADMKQLGDDLGFAFSSSFEEAIISAQSLRDVLGGLAQDIQRILLRQFATKPIADAVGAGLGRLFQTGPGHTQTVPIGGGQTATIGFAQLPARAAGGPVTAGHAYLVGERGPEPFIPRMSGMILPNSALGGISISAPITINAQGADRQSVTEISRIAQQIPGMVTSVIVQDIARDGPISKSLRR